MILQGIDDVITESRDTKSDKMIKIDTFFLKIYLFCLLIFNVQSFIEIIFKVSMEVAI